MFANKPVQAPIALNSGNRRAPAAAFLNVYKTDRQGTKFKVGAIPFEHGKAIHEALAAKFAEDENYDPKFTFELNENVQRTAEDMDID